MESHRDWLTIWIYAVGGFLLALVFIFGMSEAFSAQPKGVVSTPEEKAWFKGAQNSMRGSCCDEADGYREGMDYEWGDPPTQKVILQEWKNSEKPGEYEVKVLGEWYHVDKDHVVQCGPGKKDTNGYELPNQPCNPTGGAVVWIIPKVTGSFTVDRNAMGGIRCFAPGFQS